MGAKTPTDGTATKRAPLTAKNLGEATTGISTAGVATTSALVSCFRSNSSLKTDANRTDDSAKISGARWEKMRPNTAAKTDQTATKQNCKPTTRDRPAVRLVAAVSATTRGAYGLKNGRASPKVSV